jgi:hypothetical protein
VGVRGSGRRGVRQRDGRRRIGVKNELLDTTNPPTEKVLGQLKDAEREALIEQIKPLLSQLKKFSYGTSSAG